MTFFKTVAMAAMLLVPLSVSAHHDGDTFSLGPVTVSHAWTEETAAAAHGFDVFMTLENTGDMPVRLVGATTDFSKPGAFHAPVVSEDGSYSLRSVTAVTIAPGQTVTLQPGGPRVALQDVQETFETGEHFHMALAFAEIGTLEIEVAVEHGEEHDHDHGDDAAS